MATYPGTKLHWSLTTERVCDAVECASMSLDNPGFCVNCGAEVDSVEPDARCYLCEVCEQNTVYGAEELLIMLV